MHALRRALILGSLLAFASGCSTFNSDWKRAATAPVTAREMTGRWEGEWRSAANGHRGRLRCLMTRLDEDRYRARYRASWWKIFRFDYTVEIRVRKSAGAYDFEGEADLGWWAGGVYRYQGRVTSTNFVSSYESKTDHGTFQMKRPE